MSIEIPQKTKAHPWNSDRWAITLTCSCIAAVLGWFIGVAKKESSGSSSALRTYEHYFSCIKAINDNPFTGGFDGGGLNYFFYAEFNSLVELGSDAMPTLENIIRSDRSTVVAAHAAMAISSIGWDDLPSINNDGEFREELLKFLATKNTEHRLGNARLLE